MQLAPVVLFAYKRKDKLRDCLQALDNNFAVESTELFIFSDGAKGENDIKQVQEVRSFIEDYKGANNRAYYSIFHVINAVHAVSGKAYKRHKDAVANFNKDYVKTSVFPREMGRKIGQAEEIRHASDYDDFT